MAQPTAPILVSVVVQTTTRDFNKNPATTLEFEETLSFTTTVANYAAEIPAFAGSVFSRQQNLLNSYGGVLAFIHGSIEIDDVTATQTPATPYYSTYEGLATPKASVQSSGSKNRANFQIGPSDFTDATSLGSVIISNVRGFVQNVGF